MKRIKPHPLFSVWRADEVAECLNVPDDTYQFLWDKIVPLQPKRILFREEPTYEYPLKNFWSQVPDHHRKQLNNAAKEEDDKAQAHHAEIEASFMATQKGEPDV